MTRTAAWLACLLLMTSPAWAAETTVTGKVYQERDGKPGRGPTDPGLAGVQVSNGETIVRTAADGSYSLPVREGQTVFVIKPDEYRFPSAANGLPSYWRHYAPQGSPKLKYDGIRATGGGTRNWDFALEPAKGTDAARNGFEMLVFTDSQTASRQDIGYYQRAIVEPIIGKHPARLGTTLGDIVNDDLSLYPDINKVTAQLQVPWFHVPGNHDLDMDAGNDAHSLDSWRAVYGPDTYAVEEGGASFVFLDDVFDDGQAQPRPLPLAALLTLDPIEALGQAGQMFARHAGPMVAHRDRGIGDASRAVRRDQRQSCRARHARGPGLVERQV